MKKIRSTAKFIYQKIIFIALALGALVAFLVYRKFFPDLDLQNILNDFADFIGSWTYLIAAVFSFLETGAFVGMVAPGETLLIVSGAVAGQGVINLYLLIAIAWICAFLGDSFSFFLGQKLGRGFLEKHGKKFALNKERLVTIEKYFSAHGGKTILIGRFIGLIRAFAPFIAGSSKMSYRVFLPYSILGSGLQVSAVILLGYFFSKNINKAVEYISKGSFWFGLFVLVAFALFFGLRFIRKKENRSRLHAAIISKPYLSWMSKIYFTLKPGIVFIQKRFQPADRFGLEFTSLLAAIAVSSFIVIAYLNNIASDPELITWGDQTAKSISSSIQSGSLNFLAEIFSAFGSRWMLFFVIIIAGTALALKRKWSLLLTMVLSMFTIELWNDIISYLVDRPETKSFPNRSAAFSILYFWLAIVFLDFLNKQRTIIHKGGILITAAVFVALIGLSNVYLAENFLSDSNAGWAFGVFIFSVYSVIFLVFSQLHRLPGKRQSDSSESSKTSKSPKSLSSNPLVKKEK